MDGRLLYLDPSALVKLIVAAPETDALRDELSLWPERATSRLSVVEVVREARLRSEAAEDVARKILSGVALVNVDEEVLRIAAGLDVQNLQTSDAVHVSTALSIGSDLGSFVSYDGRMLLAADAAGLEVIVPGATL